jgi:glycosyltransferase involved in cell wall biosynthesis
MSRLRIAEIISHPIQNRVPVYRELAATPDVDFTVLFLTEHGVKPTFDPGFGQTFAYDIPLLEGYQHRFVPNVSRHPGPQGLAGAINPELARIFARERFDAVQVHGWAQASQWLSFLAARATGTPYMVSCDAQLTGAPLPRGKRLAKQLIVGEIVRYAGALLCVGRENRRFWESYGARPEQLFDSVYSVDNDFFERKAREARASGRREQLRVRAGAGPDDLLVLNSSKLIEDRKRMSVLVDALARLPRNVVAVFAGDGPDRAQLDEHIRREGVRAVVLGFVNQSELPGWYAAADVLSISSEIEPWGLVANEALASGLPVIASDHVGAAADLVVPGQTGDVYPTGDATALATSLRKLLDDPALRTRMSQQCLAWIARYHPRVSAAGVVAAARAASERQKRSAA